ncbi:hypothetical protein [Streptomyces sp. NPDC018352]|uniref:hypothetical protein n=1 Tax=Streptomyces sp. NPDC018352 TaxID=3157194 RepID=UPI0033CD67CA
MSTTRRPLGLGPATSPTASPDRTAQRLLPAERAGGDGLVGVGDEDQAVVEPRGRRVLGPGFSTSKGVVEK